MSIILNNIITTLTIFLRQSFIPSTIVSGFLTVFWSELWLTHLEKNVTSFIMSQTNILSTIFNNWQYVFNANCYIKEQIINLIVFLDIMYIINIRDFKSKYQSKNIDTCLDKDRLGKCLTMSHNYAQICKYNNYVHNFSTTLHCTWVIHIHYYTNDILKQVKKWIVWVSLNTLPY